MKLSQNTCLVKRESKRICLARYLEMLMEYLQDYTDRVKPLLDQNELYGKILGEFEKKWEAGTFPGWPVSVIVSSGRFSLTSHASPGNMDIGC